MSSDHGDDDPQAEKIFELQQEIIRLRGQITYLQEELASAEDKINELERSIGENDDEHS